MTHRVRGGIGHEVKSSSKTKMTSYVFGKLNLFSNLPFRSESSNGPPIAATPLDCTGFRLLTGERLLGDLCELVS